MLAIKLIGFTIFLAGTIYLLNCLIARQWKKIEIRQALVYMSGVAMIGVFGEIFLDTIYNYFFHSPLWRYTVLPVHHAYTSKYAIVIWAIYGFHLYLLHGSLGTKWSITRTKHLALIFSIEALVLEAFLNLASLVVFGKYMYYYLPGNLGHISALQNMPFYYICGVLILKAIPKFKQSPRFFIELCLWLIFILIFLA